jgi:hypothetical protein
MKKRLIAFAGVMLLLLGVSIPSAFASPGSNRGYDLNGSGYDGLHAIVSTMVGTGNPPAFTFNAKSPDVYQYFASSQIRPKNSCVSVDVAARRDVGSSTTTHKIYIGNWCTGGSAQGPYEYDITNSTFRSKYVRTNTFNDTGTAFQDEVMEFRVILLDAGTNKWGAYIYNNTTATYDLLSWISGSTGGFNDGWVDIGDGGYTQDPTMYCPTLYPWGIMQIRAIQKRVSGSWSNISSSDITGTIADSWPCLSTNNYQERRSIAYQFKIEPYGVSY